jgi:short-subunit dehydrogenase
MARSYLSNQKTALVTGASSGIGEAFARNLAGQGVAILVTALPAESERLRALASELSMRNHVRTEVVTLDLAGRDAAWQLQAAADELAFEPDMLVNSAGIGAGGVFAGEPLERHLDMIHLNVEALVSLTGLYLPRMVNRRRGIVVNIASTAAFAPMPYLAVYAASKSFVLNFSQALWAYYHRRGVRFLAVCPGPVASRFH